MEASANLEIVDSMGPCRIQHQLGTQSIPCRSTPGPDLSENAAAGVLVNDVVRRALPIAEQRRTKMVEARWAGLCQRYVDKTQTNDQVQFGLELILAQMEGR